MTAWARLTWQTSDPAWLVDDLHVRLGAPVTSRGLVPGSRVLHLGTAILEVRPWVREGPADTPTPAGRLMLEPVPGGEEPPEDDAAGKPDPARLVLVAVAWSTVDTDRAEGDLDMWLDPAPPHGPVDAIDTHLGARVRLRGAAGLPGDWLALVEPSTEGRAAAALARDGEGPCALYLTPPAGLDAWLESTTARGVAVRGGSPEPGPFGLQLALAGAPPAGPHVIVTAGRTPASLGAGASTIGA